MTMCAHEPSSDAVLPKLSLPGRVMVMFVRIYQGTLSTWLGGQCRFTPSCSRYFIEAVNRHGAWRGGWLGVRRLLRCHPFGRGGYDPVP